jgi:hypothetical protein
MPYSSMSARIPRRHSFSSKFTRRPQQAIPPRSHNYKYRLVYVVGGQSVIRYDNEFGKCDHRHWGGQEGLYGVSDVDWLIADFSQAWKSGQAGEARNCPPCGA